MDATARLREQDGVSLIAAERHRQQGAEGWTPEHDDEHRNGEMAVSAARYALHDAGAAWPEPPAVHDAKTELARAWQWQSCWWKPKDPIRNLVRAGALIAAEIDRRLRAGGHQPAASPVSPLRSTPQEGTTDEFYASPSPVTEGPTGSSRSQPDGSAHTPAPWRFDGHYRIMSGPELPMCVATIIGGFDDAVEIGPTSIANARLIAAAPELLAALKAVTQDMDQAGGDGYGMPECPWCKCEPNHEHAADCDLLAARAAIAHAEGRS